MCQILERGMFKWPTSECVQSGPKAVVSACARMAQRASGDTRRRVKYVQRPLGASFQVCVLMEDRRSEERTRAPSEHGRFLLKRPHAGLLTL